MIRTTFLAAAAVLGLTQGAFAQGPGKATDVTLMYTAASPFVAAYVAQDQGYFEKHGVNVRMQVAQNGSVIVAALVSNSAQVGLPTPTVMLQAVDHGLDLRTFATANLYPDPTPAGLVVTPDSGIHSAKDLAGKKIGVPGLGGLLDVVLRKWVDEKGGDSRKINYVEVRIPQAADVIRSRQVDGVATVDPFFTRAVRAGGVSLGNYTEIIPDGTAAGIFTTTAAWAKAHPAAIKAMQQALDEAAAFIAKHPDEARASVAKYTKLPPPVVAHLTLPNTSNLHLDPARSLGFWNDVAVQQGLISKPVDLKTVVIPFQG